MIWTHPAAKQEMTTMSIDFHFWPTPNGWKISIALEEMGLPYQVGGVEWAWVLTAAWDGERWQF